MDYDVIVLACKTLNYRDKLRLAQLLIQIARQEEEKIHPINQVDIKTTKNQTENKQISANNTDIKVPKESKAKQTTIKDTIKTKVELNNIKDPVEYVLPRILKLKPAKLQSLSNSISSMFQYHGGISKAEIEKIILTLQKRKIIKIEQNNVKYL